MRNFPQPETEDETETEEELIIEKIKNITLEEDLDKTIDEMKNTSKIHLVCEEVAKRRGEICEDMLVKKYNIKDNNNRLYYYTFGSNYFKLCGRIDGYKNGKLCEIKTRRYKFLGLKDYEKIQIQLYMLLTKSRECLLLEKFKDEEKETIEYYDDDYCKDILMRLEDNIIEIVENGINDISFLSDSE